MILKNPDPRKVYDLWRWCPHCLGIYTHSQGDWNYLKDRDCCRDHLRSVSTSIAEIEVVQETITFWRTK